ncbi:hypothetical protein H0H93_008594 [Arthromyces matolae]|nr:hypothetical protein H0H93_008594 [Arthromyces matolae]
MIPQPIDCSDQSQTSQIDGQFRPMNKITIEINPILLEAFDGHPTSIVIQIPSDQPKITQAVVENVTEKILKPIEKKTLATSTVDSTQGIRRVDSEEEDRVRKSKRAAFTSLIRSLRDSGVDIGDRRSWPRSRKRTRFQTDEHAPSDHESTNNSSLNWQAPINAAHPGPADLDSPSTHANDNKVHILNRQAPINPAHPADLDSRHGPLAGVKRRKKLVSAKPSTHANDIKKTKVLPKASLLDFERCSRLTKLFSI